MNKYAMIKSLSAPIIPLAICVFFMAAAVGAIFFCASKMEESKAAERAHELEMAKIGYIQVIENGEKLWKSKPVR